MSATTTVPVSAEPSKRPAPPPLKRFRYAAEAAALGTLARAVTLLPRRAVLALGRAVGLIAYALLRHDRQVAHANLDIVFGDAKPRAEKRRIVRNTFGNFASTIFGLFWAPRLTADNFRAWVDVSPETEARVAALREGERGAIFVTPHYGDWEMLSLALGFMGVPCMAVVEPTPNPALGELVTRMRTRSGHVTIPPRFAVIKLFRHLSRGGSIGMLLDVNGRRGRGGLWLDFFGLPVFSSPTAVELALRADAAIVFLYSRPRPGGRMEMVVEGEIEPARTGDRAADVRDTSQRCLDRCAQLIREDPGPWLWTYKRWKRRPAPEVGRFPFYSKYDAKT